MANPSATGPRQGSCPRRNPPDPPPTRAAGSPARTGRGRGTGAPPPASGPPAGGDLPPISILDGATCGAPFCDLAVCTNVGGDRTMHYLERDQTDRLVHPGYSDCPIQVTAYDSQGVAHRAVRP